MTWKRGVALVGGLLVAATVGAAPAGAAADQRAVCIGEFISLTASSTQGPAIGSFASRNARAWGGLGHLVGEEARTDTCVGG